MSSRATATWVLAALAVAFVVTLWLTTPWHPLGGAIPGGSVPARVTGDFSTHEVARADAYRGAVRPLAWADQGVGLLVLLVLGLTPAGARLVGATERLTGGRWPLTLGLGTVLVLAATRVVALPFDARIHVLSRRYGLSRRSWSGWAIDLAKGWALSSLLVAAVLIVVVLLVRRFPQGWWLPVAAGAAGFVLLASFLYPLVVEPLFNSFTPLPAGALRTELLAMARRDGVPVDDVLVADASKRTSALNAYVSGYGSTRRIVLYDTLLDTAPKDQVELVVAHELGHAKRNDVLHGTLLGALGAAAGVVLIFLLLQWAPLLRRAGVASLTEPGAAALVLTVAMVLVTVASPVQLLVSRRIEARADVHSLDLTRDPETFARMQRQLALSNLNDLTPSPVVTVLFGSHPTPTDRIAMARDWARLHHKAEPGPLLESP